MTSIQNKQRGSQDFSKGLMQKVLPQKENKTPTRSLSPFLQKTQRSRSGSPDKINTINLNNSFATLKNGKVEYGSSSKRDIINKSIKNNKMESNSKTDKSNNSIDISQTNIYTKETSNKCSINRLGLQLRPYCGNKDHKKSNITHICVDDKCFNTNINNSDEQQQFAQRLSCQYCILQMHHSHKEACIPIEQFTEYIDQQFLSVISNFKDLNLQSLKLNNPPFLQKAYESLNVLKLAVCQNIDNLKIKIKSQISSRFEEFIPNFQERINNYSILNTQFKNISSRNIFELNEQEVDLLLKFSKEEFIEEMNQFRKKMMNICNSIEYQTELASQHYQSSISNLVQSILINNESLILPTKKDILSVPGNSKMKFLKLQYIILQKKQEDIFKNLKELKHMMSDEDICSQSVNQTYITPSDLSNGKLLIYSEQCKHNKDSNCNTVPIFSCCKQAYQCSKCHNQYTMHKAAINEPSQRLCMKCLTIFTVAYTTETQINCNSCLDPKQFTEQVAFNMLQSIVDDKKSVRASSPQPVSPYHSRTKSKNIKDEKNNTQVQSKLYSSQSKKEGRISPNIFNKNVISYQSRM